MQNPWSTTLQCSIASTRSAVSHEPFGARLSAHATHDTSLQHDYTRAKGVRSLVRVPSALTDSVWSLQYNMAGRRTVSVLSPICFSRDEDTDTYHMMAISQSYLFELRTRTIRTRQNTHVCTPCSHTSGRRREVHDRYHPQFHSKLDFHQRALDLGLLTKCPQR